MSAQEYLELIAAISAAVLGILAVGAKLIYKPLKRSLEVFIDERLRPIEDILMELKPNGGSSMKDSMARMEQRIDDLYKLVAGK